MPWFYSSDLQSIGGLKCLLKENFPHSRRVNDCVFWEIMGMYIHCGLINIFIFVVFYFETVKWPLSIVMSSGKKEDMTALVPVAASQALWQDSETWCFSLYHQLCIIIGQQVVHCSLYSISVMLFIKYYFILNQCLFGLSNPKWHL